MDWSYDAAIFILNAEETQQVRATDEGRKALEAAITEKMASPGIDHYQYCVLSATHALLLYVP